NVTGQPRLWAWLFGQHGIEPWHHTTRQPWPDRCRLGSPIGLAPEGAMTCAAASATLTTGAGGLLDGRWTVVCRDERRATPAGSGPNASPVHSALSRPPSR